MSTTGGRPDDELGLRLERALDEGLRAGPVDTTALVTGARAGARRIRRRRTVAAGVAAALVVAVPVGVLTTTGRGGGSPADVAARPSQSASATVRADATTTATGSAPEAPEVDPATLGSEDAAVEIPSSVGLTPEDLPVPATLDAESRFRIVPVVNGMQCSTSATGPIAGYFQGFAEANSQELAQLAVYVTVTAWSRGDGATAYADALANTGECVFDDDAPRTPWTPSLGSEAFQSSGYLEANEAGTAVLRLGDVVVGVQTSGPVAGYDYVALSSELAQTVGQRVADAQVAGSSAP